MSDCFCDTKPCGATWEASGLTAYCDQDLDHEGPHEGLAVQRFVWTRTVGDK